MKTTGLDENVSNRFHRGTLYNAYEMLGAHFVEQDGKRGVRFAVWAKNAASVSVVGDFNGWDINACVMERMDDGEIWSIFIEGIDNVGGLYKYAIMPQNGETPLFKADPYGFYAELRPGTASRLYDLNRYTWHDEAWFERQTKESSYDRPMLTYEVHAGSWRRGENGKFLSYRDLADQLLDYVCEMKYTHIEFMPLAEHSYDGSWGYQTVGYYAVTSRYGTPDDFRYLVDMAHRRGIGIIVDWVPGHFSSDEQGLAYFDGMPLYESDNPQRAQNKLWGTVNFDYGRPEVQSFLISNALFWFEEYHVDGLRIDGVANMLYLNFGREAGEWTPNRYGGTGNLDAMEFLKKLNETVFKYHPQALMLAEESTDWPLISKPVYLGGMGFNYKWNMGWTYDMLGYISLDPIYRKWNHDKVTFSFVYAFNENFVLSLSHDEATHGKGSLIGRMPGDYWQKFAGLRGFFGYFMSHPGKKLVFMGAEYGQFDEWNWDASLEWNLPEQYEKHQQMLAYSKALNKFYVEHRAFWQVDFDWNGFQWIDCNDNENSVISFIRKADNADDYIVVVCNFTPEVRHDYRIGVPDKGAYIEVFNSDREEFGGSGVTNDGELYTEDIGVHNRAQSLNIIVPPLATVYLRPKAAQDRFGCEKVSDTSSVEKLPCPEESEIVWQEVPGKIVEEKPKRRGVRKAKPKIAEEKPAKKNDEKKTVKKADKVTDEPKPVKRGGRRKMTEEEKAAARAKRAAKKAAEEAAEKPADEAPKRRRRTRKTEETEV